jgi:hypothetical protein
MTMPSAHLRVEQIADLSAGLLDSAEASRAEAHLAGCDKCSVWSPTSLPPDECWQPREPTRPQCRPASPPGWTPHSPPSGVRPWPPPLGHRPPGQVPAQSLRSIARRPSRAWLPQALVAAASVAVLGAAIGIGASQLGDQDGAASVDAQGSDAFGRVEGNAASPPPGTDKSEAADGDMLGSPQQGSTTLEGLRSATLADQLDRLLAKHRSPPYAAADPLDEATTTCVRSALGREPSPTWSVYPAELDGRSVQLVVTSSGSEPLRALALECTGRPRVVATVPTG